MPADLATGSEEEIEEELRLTYVATTRARDYLYVLWPLRYYSKSGGLSDNYSYAQCCRFFTGDVTQTMECITPAQKVNEMDTPAAGGVSANIHNQINKMWD